MPVAVVGLLAKDLITGPLRSLWVVALALILWSGVMWAAERRHDVLERRRMQRGEGGVTLRDGLVIGLVQCFSLIPGVSRSGATISAGLFARPRPGHRHPALVLHGDPGAHRRRALRDEGRRHRGPRRRADAGRAWSSPSWWPTPSIAWLLRFVAGHPITVFVWYRVGLGVLLIVALSAGWLTAA